MKKKISIFLCFVLILTTFAACGKKDTDATDKGDRGNNYGGVTAAKQELAVWLGSDPDTIDPALNSSADGASMLLHTFEGLMNLDKNGTPVYGVAESYTVSEDELVYTFKLRSDAKWSDGQSVTAGDFVYAWNRAVSSETASDYEYMFDVVDGYEDADLNVVAEDDSTLVVTLKSLTPYFLELCAFPVYFPVRQDVIEAYGDAWAVKPETYIGNGSYKISEWVSGSHITMVKNENYWNIEEIGPDSIKCVLMEDDNAVLAAYKQGEILFADQMPNDEIDAWKERPDFYLEGQLGTYYVSFNTERIPDPLIRKALILAVDREWICEQIGKSGQEPAAAFVSTGLTDADPAKEFREVGGDYYDPYDYEGNLELAKQALADAGYPNGEGLPIYEYIYNEGTGHQAVAEALQDMWAKIGVRLELVSQDWATFLNTRKDGGYDIARNGWLSDYNDPISMLDMWITGGGNNDAQWSNAEYDSLIKQIKSSSDKIERIKLMHQAEDIIFKEWMLCPIYYYVDLYLLSEKVQGAWSSPLGYKYFMFSTITE